MIYSSIVSYIVCIYILKNNAKNQISNIKNTDSLKKYEYNKLLFFKFISQLLIIHYNEI